MQMALVKFMLKLLPPCFIS